MTAGVVHLRLPGVPESIARARRAVEEVSVAVGLHGERLDDLRLLVSELVTNCVRHAKLAPEDTIELVLRPTRSGIRVEVSDDGPGFDPVVHEPVESQTSGWGLLLVSRLAHRWGAERSTRTTVWFELDANGGRGQVDGDGQVSVHG